MSDARSVAGSRVPLHAETSLGSVSLNVADLDRQVAFYREVLGFEVQRRAGRRAWLGAGEEDLLELVEVSGARRPPRSTGLYHFAVLLPLKRKLGLHRARVVLSGAAPIAPSVLEFFLGLGVPIREIYGQTEGSGPTCANQERIKLGTVGPPLPGIEVKIAPDGEILVRGPNVFQGYYRDPEATAATLREGWLHSGDIGVLDEDGFLRITDRKKDLIITAGGKNVAPQFLENKLKASPYINDAIVIGDGLKYLTALIVIDEDNVAKWAADHKVPFTTFGDLAANEQVEGLIAREVEAVNGTLSRAEEVKRFALLPRRLHQEDGDVTPTLKVKRAAVMKKYADLIGSLYSDATPRRARAAGN